MLVKSLKLLLLLKSYSAKKKKKVSSSHIGLFLILQGRKTPQFWGFGITVIPETEKPCLETTAHWAALLSSGVAEPLLGELNVRSGNKCFKNRKKEAWTVISGKQSIKEIM